MSGPVSTTAYVRERIYEVLVNGNGTNRTLAEADRFLRGLPPSKAQIDARARDARVNKRVFVFIPSMAVMDGNAAELGDYHRYSIDVVLNRDYWLGFEGSATEVDATLAEIETDFMKIRAALCWPGNLTQTEGANATGLASNSLTSEGATSQQTIESQANGRLIQVRDRFRADFLFDPDA